MSASVREGSPTYARVLGGIADSCGDLERALPLLEDAVRRSEDRLGHPDRLDAQRELFSAYAHARRWRDMEGLITAEWLWDGSRPLVEAARAAAGAGARTDSLRIWSRAANLDRGDVAGIEVLVAAGLRDELVGFYERVGAADPACAYVAPILAELRAPKGNR